MNVMDQIIAYKNGEMTREEMVDFFRDLVETGLAWVLPDRYGETARSLIERGMI